MTAASSVLVRGGAGHIGSHGSKAPRQQGATVVIDVVVEMAWRWREHPHGSSEARA